MHDFIHVICALRHNRLYYTCTLSPPFSSFFLFLISWDTFIKAPKHIFSLSWSISCSIALTTATTASRAILRKITYYFLKKQKGMNLCFISNISFIVIHALNEKIFHLAFVIFFLIHILNVKQKKIKKHKADWIPVIGKVRKRSQ